MYFVLNPSVVYRSFRLQMYVVLRNAMLQCVVTCMGSSMIS